MNMRLDDFTPLFNQVVILPFPDTVQIGSIHLPEIAEEQRRAGRYEHLGRVVKVGDGYKYGFRFLNKQNREDVEWFPLPQGKAALTVKPGDVVIYAHRGGEDHVFDGVVYRVTPENHISGIVDEEPKQDPEEHEAGVAALV